MATVVEAVAPRSSVTVSVAVYDPAVAYVWFADDPVPTAPSPKLHAHATTFPSESVEPDASKLTASGAAPELGLAVARAVGGWFTPLPAGTISRVTVCAGSESAMCPPEIAASPSRAIALLA